MKGLVVSVDPQNGTNIQTACGSAKELSELIKQDLDFYFNGVRITTKNQSIQEMVNSYAIQRK